MKLKFSRKRTILAVSAIGVLGLVVGGTLAVSHDRSVMENQFRLAGYHTLFTEEFDAPRNWMTCETIDKTLTVTNDSESSGAVAVRVKLEEQWIASDGVTELPLVSAASGLTMAQINFTANSGWTKKGSYYYYDTDLAKGATSTSLITGVTLNCDANLDTTATAAANSDGVYSNATYKLNITAQAIDAGSKDEWSTSLAGIIREKANNLGDYTIEFTRKAVASKDISTANGNGVNRYQENGQDVYYFRGEIADNNVIWADKCWKVVRTTATGGTKMIYNGLPTTVNESQQCNATDPDNHITVNVSGSDVNSFLFNNESNSPADVGYMYGTRITVNSMRVSSSDTFTFSNDVSRSGNTYTLDTSAGQSITGIWEDEILNAATRYHYFCTNGLTVCNSDEIGYIYVYWNEYWISYLKVGGYDDIEDMKAAMFTNTTDSNAKAMVETWFEQQNLDGHVADTRNYEDDLEDVVFCNDRSLVLGALKSKDSDASPNTPGASFSDNRHSRYGSYGRVVIRTAGNNYEPNLGCANNNDAFTKDLANGNGKLRHKVGLITADELTLAGTIYTDAQTSYLANSEGSIWFDWSISPFVFSGSASEFNWGRALGYSTVSSYNLYGGVGGLRPMVSLKAGTEVASGSGLATDPYIIE